MVTQEQYFAELIKHSGSVLKLSQNQIREKYKDYPICLMEYIDKGENKKCIEIRFYIEGADLICHFDEDNKCHSSYLLFDKEEAIDDVIDYLIENSGYSFKFSRWELPDCFMKTRKGKHDIFLMFYPKE